MPLTTDAKAGLTRLNPGGQGQARPTRQQPWARPARQLASAREGAQTPELRSDARPSPAKQYVHGEVTERTNFVTYKPWGLEKSARSGGPGPQAAPEHKHICRSAAALPPRPAWPIRPEARPLSAPAELQLGCLQAVGHKVKVPLVAALSDCS